MKTITLNILAFVITGLIVGAIIIGSVSINKAREDASEEYKQKQKSWFQECLIKTNNDIEWCFDELDK